MSSALTPPYTLPSTPSSTLIFLLCPPQRAGASTSTRASRSSEKRKAAAALATATSAPTTRSKSAAPSSSSAAASASASSPPSGGFVPVGRATRAVSARGPSPAPSPAQSPRASPRATPGKAKKRHKRGGAGADEEVDEATATEAVRKLRKPREPFKKLPGELVYDIFSFLVECEERTIETMMSVSQQWKRIANDRMLWRGVRQFNEGGEVNWRNFRKLKKKSAGTEGICHKCLCRSTGEVLAVKKARVFPEGEGVAYYMLRELAVLQDMAHPHVNKLAKANLSNDELHIFFPYVERTLQDVLVGPNPNAMEPPSGKTPLSPHQVRRLLHQLLDATSYCHRRGVYHRNLKPKHLLLDVPQNAATGELDLDEARLQIADFALVRASGLPRRNYTAKVVTLWYRAPEILMGVKKYSGVVDAWSVGCVFAEMALGRPLFTGSSEIDQLFQLFSTLGTPNNSVWEGFTELPNYKDIFPNWPPKPITKIVPDLDPLGQQLLQRLLEFDPAKRITTEEALRHPYFTGPCEPECALVPFIEMPSEEEVPAAQRDIHHLHKHMRETEVKSWPIAGYRGTEDEDTQPGQDALHRAMLVDWLVELVDVFDMYLRSAFLAVAYTDAFLSRTTVSRDKLQLVAATCLHVASKCEDTAYISVNDLVMCADNLYTSQEVLRMEERLLNVLDFRLGVPNVYDFLKLLMEKLPELLPPASDLRWLSEYLAELSMQVCGLGVTVFAVVHRAAAALVHVIARLLAARHFFLCHLFLI